jgi:PAS domain S-box-containing protein
MSPTQRTILIVDDSPEDRELYRRYLLRDGTQTCTVLEASLGREGLALWQQQQPDMVLLDYRLPDLDGLEFLAQLPSPLQQPCLPVIMLTGLGNEAIAVRALKAGAQDYLVKEQLTPEGLQLAVSCAIEAVQLRTQLHQRIERERLVAQITRKIHQTLDLEEILQTTVTEVRQFLQTDRVLVFRLQPDGRGTITTESVGAGWTPLLYTCLYDPCFNEHYIESFRQGLVTVKPNIDDGSIAPCHVELLASLQVRANLVVPIIQNQQLWGMLIAHHCSAPRQWQELEVDLLQELATQLGIALHQAELYQQLQRELAERKRAEVEREQLVQALAEERARLESVLHQMPEGVMVADAATGKLLLSNQQANQILQFNYPPNLELEQYEATVPFQAYRSDGTPYAAGEYPLARSLRTGEVIAHEEIELRYFDGSRIFIDTSAVPILDSQGQIISAVTLFQDMTQRKQTEAALRDSEQRFRQLAENTNVVFWVSELPERQLSYVSPAYERLWGLNPQDVYDDHKNWTNLLHPDDREATATAFEQKAFEGKFDEEYRIILPDGRVRWVHDRCFPLRDESGRVYRLTGIAEDITDRKQVEEALRQGEQQLRIARDAAALGIHDYDITTGTIQWDARVREIWGVGPDEPITYEVFMAGVHPQDRAATQAALERAVDPTGNGRYEAEYRVTHRNDGRTRWIVATGTVFFEHERPVRLVGTVQDITDRKQAEADLRESEDHLRYTVELNPQVPWTAAPDGRITGFSQRWLKLTGLSHEQALGNGWMRVPHPEDVEAMAISWSHSITTGDPYDIEYRIRLADGSYRWMRSRAFPRRNDQGEILRWYGTTEDIHDRKQAEEALRVSEAEFRTIANAAPALVWVCSATGENIFINDRWYEYTGQSLEEAHGFGWTSRMHPDDTTRILPYWQHCCQTGEPYEGEVRYHRQDGEYRWHHFRALPQRNEAGTIAKWFGCSVEIHDAKLAEAATATNEARLRGFFESDVVGMLYGDIHGNIHTTNDELLRTVGYTRADLEAGRLRWIDITPPEYLPLDAQAIAEARATGACTPYEKEYIRKDGSRVPILIGYSLVGEAREESVAFILDLTQRKQAEREAQEGKQILDALMEYVPEGITIADAPDVTIRRVSRYGQQLAGSSPGVFEGISMQEHAKNWGIFYPDEVTPASHELLPLTRAVQQGEVVTNEEWVLQRLDGSKITLLCNASPIYVNGKITGGVVVWRDISDRVQIERDRERILQQEQLARAEAERANRIKDEFLAVLSHELRSPLNPILGWSRLLQMRSFDTAKTAEALGIIERNAKLQTQLIDDLLDIAKILRGKLSMNVTTVDLVFIIEAASETVRTAATAKAIDLRFTIDDFGLGDTIAPSPTPNPQSPQFQVSGDPARLQQIVWNLLSNAIKFTPERGQVTVKLSLVNRHLSLDDRPLSLIENNPETTYAQPPVTQYAQITVTDTGKGISPDFLPHIFESFRQEDASTTRRYGGLGLGLAIVRSLVEAHGGTIFADSEGEGRGATFTVRLPLLQPERTALQSASPPHLSPSAHLPLSGIRVLTVDDEPDSRTLFTTVLTQYGAEVMTVASAIEVLDCLEAFQPDVLISDIGMPDMDGYALLQQVRMLPPERGGQVPAIALTAYAREEDQENALEQGFQHHLSKPIDLEILVQVVSTLAQQAY